MDSEMLKAQLHTFRTEFVHARGNPTVIKPDIFDIKDYFHSLISAQCALLYQVSTVLQLFLLCQPQMLPYSGLLVLSGG
jgi:hypothetical protein